MTGAESSTMTRRGEADPALVRAAQRGDPMALGELMEILAPYVGRICGPIALQDGPDATQETLITILRGIRGLKEPAALFGWVRVIAVREAVRVARAIDGSVPWEKIKRTKTVGIMRGFTKERKLALFAMAISFAHIDERRSHVSRSVFI